MKRALVKGCGALIAINFWGCSPEVGDFSPIDEPQETEQARTTVAQLRNTFGVDSLPALEKKTTSSSSAQVTHQGPSGRFSLRDRASGAQLEVELKGNQTAQLEIGDDVLVGHDALGTGVHLIQRLLPDGIEDFIHFPERPRSSGIAFSITLSEGLAHLRQVDRALEFLDAGGAPRLRVSAPYLVDANKHRVPVNLTVEGCDVDRDPSPPWDRPLVEPGSSICQVYLSWPEDVRYPILVDPAWVTTTNSSVPRVGHTLTKLANGRVLSVGGIGAYISLPVPEGWEPSGIYQPGVPEVEIFDPLSQTWAFTGSIERRHSHIAELLNDGTVLIAGGLDGELFHNDHVSSTLYVSSAQRYNPTTGTWTTVQPPLSAFRARASSALLNDGTVFVVGGEHGKDSASSAETYDPVQNLWVATGALQRPRARLEATRLNDGRVLVVGGGSPGTSEIYNPSTRFFNTLRDLPSSLGPPLTEVGYNQFSNKGYFLTHPFTLTRLPSGEILSASHRAAIYDPVNAIWREVGSPLLARAGGHTAELLPNGNIAIFGGSNLKIDDSHLYSELFRPTYYGGLWTPNTSGGLGSVGVRSITLNSGKILLHGGSTNGSLAVEARATVIHEPTEDTSIHVSDYWLPAGPLPHTFTELKGRLYRPLNFEPGRIYPVVLILHLRGPACTNSSGQLANWDNDVGGCPSGFSSRNLHLGYGYLGEELARQGYIVVSANWDSASMSDPDGSTIMPIAEAGARHLRLLHEWNTGYQATPVSIGANLLNRLNLSQVGVIGHSNAGVAIAHLASGGPGNQSRAITVRAFFAIAPVEGEMPNHYDSPSINGLNWVGLIPSCDQDGGLSSTHILELRSKFDDTGPQFAASNFVPGANHNFYNTQISYDEWTDRVPRCGNHQTLFPLGANGSTSQLQTALRPALSLILSKVGVEANSLWLRTFDPLRRFPNHPASESGYVDAQLVLENFGKATGTGKFNRPTS